MGGLIFHKISQTNLMLTYVVFKQIMYVVCTVYLYQIIRLTIVCYFHNKLYMIRFFYITDLRVTLSTTLLLQNSKAFTYLSTLHVLILILILVAQCTTYCICHNTTLSSLVHSFDPLKLSQNFKCRV